MVTSNSQAPFDDSTSILLSHVLTPCIERLIDSCPPAGRAHVWVLRDSHERSAFASLESGLRSLASLGSLGSLGRRSLESLKIAGAEKLCISVPSC